MRNCDKIILYILNVSFIMKIRRILLLFLLIIVSAAVFASCSAKQGESAPELELMNRCAGYIEEFSSSSPADALALKKVSDDCKALLDSGYFDEFYEESLFKQNSVISGREDEYKESHRCEIMMIRLKCLLLSDDFEAYGAEFQSYIRQIESNAFTYQRFPEFFKNDADLKLSEEQLEAVMNAYRAAADSCTDEIEKYILYKEEYSFVSFYSVDEALKQKLFEKFNSIKELMGDDAFKKHYNDQNRFEE